MGSARGRVDQDARQAHPILTSLGSTETAPPAIICHWTMDVTGSIGLPLPALEAKLVPAGDKTEIRFKGPNISPGYYRDAERTAEAFGLKTSTKSATR
ncbi:MAG: AMP-binding protein [Alphaproteobacteria bacterium]